MSAALDPTSPSTTPALTRNAWAQGALLVAVAVLANLLVLALATAAGASMEVDQAGATTSVTAPMVIAASILPLTLGLLAYGWLGRRLPLVRRLWVPAIAVLGLLSLVPTLSAADAATTASLAAMHLVVAAVAAFGAPARLR